MLRFNKKQEMAIRSYKYNGGDNSLTYKYILSPFAQFFVDYFVPSYVAPNLITLLGLLITVSCCILTLIMNPSLGSECPKYVYLLTALSILAYQTLDNMDGKQARKTNSSSSLGMLFDHTCDTLNAFIIVLLISSSFSTGWSMNMFICIYTGYIPFYFQTWEEYHLHAMILPIFNGPSEGLLMVAIVSLISFFKGSQWWHEKQHFQLSNEYQWDVSPFFISFTIALFLTITTACIQVIQVLMTVRRRNDSVLHALIHLIPFLVFMASMMVWMQYSDIALPVYPLFSHLTLGSVFCELIFHNILADITQAPFRPFQRYTAYLTAFLPLSLLLPDSISIIITTTAAPLAVVDRVTVETGVLIALAAITFPLLILNIYSSITGFAAILNIHVFSLSPPLTPDGAKKDKSELRQKTS